MAIITTAITTLTDLNDAIISGTQPINPTAGTLWIDSSKSPAVLKIYKNGAWMAQDLDLNSLDPNMAESIRNVVATIGNMSNDNLLDYKERQIIKDDLTEILGKVLLDTETILPTVAQLDSLAKGSFYSTRRNALNAGIEITNTTYVNVATQYQNLKTYLESLAPIKPWNVAVADKDKNVTVIKNTFRDKWLQYYLATEQLSLTTTEKIKEAQENLDGKIDEVSLRDKTEILSGNPIFTDKADDSVVHVEIDGKSVGGGSGKNLFNAKAYVALEKDLPQAGTYALTTDNKIQVNRTDSRGVSKSLYRYFVKLEKNTDYTFSADIIMQWRIFLFTEDSDAGITKQAIAKSTTFNSGESTLLALKVYPLSLEYPVIVGDLQLEKGSTATTYELPVPSPDYPIAIKSAFDWRRENIFLASKVVASKMTSTTSEGLEAFTNSDVDGIFYPIQGEPNKQYTLTFEYKHTQGTNPLYLKFYYSDGTDDGTSQGALDATVLSTKSITSAVNKTIIGVGYKGYNESIVWKSVTTYEVVPFTTVRQNDATQLLGTEVVKTQGVNGSIKVVTEHEYVNNVVSGNKRELSRTTETVMIPKVILVGTKQPDDVIEWRPVTTYEAINFTTTRQDDSTIAVGTEVVKTQGINGRIKVITEFEYVNSVATGNKREVSRVTETAMVPKVILVGTKKIADVTFNFTVTEQVTEQVADVTFNFTVTD